MTTASDAHTSVEATPVAAWRSVPHSFLRLLRIELRRSPMPLLLPLIAALFWFDSYRPSTTQAPLWVLRTFWNMGQGHTIIDTGPFVAAMAAWIGSRDGRRRTVDLVTTIARTQWTARLATWAATAIWAAGSYLLLVGIMFGVYAAQGVAGRPPWWWVAVGATAVVAFSAAGYAIGVVFPSRFAAPLAALGGFLAMTMSSQTGFQDQTGWAQVLPTNSNGNFQPDSGLFYPYLPDLPIARILLLAGILFAILGLLGLSRSAGGRTARWVAVIVTAAGLAGATTGIGLAATARLGPHGMSIPALHDAAADRPIPYTPACATASGVPVCVNPAYRPYLPDLTVALTPVFAEIAGLPEAPTRVTQTASVYTFDASTPAPEVTVRGDPPILAIALGDDTVLPGSSGFSSIATSHTQFIDQMRIQVVVAYISGETDGNPAQQAIEAALLNNAGIPFASQTAQRSDISMGPATPPTADVIAAAQRFAALPAAERTAWLTANLAALRAGQITLERLP